MKIIQNIQIGTLTINSIGGASIIQIGSSGMIQSHCESYAVAEPAAITAPAAPPEAPPPPPNAVKVQIPGVVNNNNTQSIEK